MNDALTLDDSPQLVLLKMAEGNPGAVTVCVELLKSYPVEGLIAILNLDDMEIRGYKMWLGYKDYCNQDINLFFECCMNRDKKMQKFIKEYE